MLPVVKCIPLDSFMWADKLWRYWLYGCLPSGLHKTTFSTSGKVNISVFFPWNHCQIIYSNPQLLEWAVLYKNYVLPVSLHRGKCASTHGREEEIHRNKDGPTWNCLQQGLWIIFSNLVMISRKRHCCWVFQMYFMVFWAPQAECHLTPLYSREGRHL